MEDAGRRLTDGDDDGVVARNTGARNADPTATEEANIRKLERAGPSAAASATDSRKRLMRDLKAMQNAPEGITAHPHNDDLMHWKAVIFGPEDTIWQGGIFKLELHFTTEYPMSPPKVKFMTPVFHPNVYKDGNICMDIMKSQWSPVYDVSALLLSIQSLLSDPNPNSAANGEAAEMYAKQRREYELRVQNIVDQSLEDADDDDDEDDNEDEGNTQ
jgi:ubiquitin-conjugating enzyme E2 A